MADLRERVLDRLDTTARLFDWSEAHVDGFLDGVDEALADVGAVLAKDSWHRAFDNEEFCFKNREARLPPDALRALGRHDAWRAVESWSDGELADWSQEDVWRQVRFWWDGGVCSYPSAEADAELVDDFGVSRLLLIKPASWWEKWIVDQHHAHMAEGGEGFADLFLERHWYPKFFVENGGDAPDVLDGWHRSAADVLTGQVRARAVVITRKPEFVPVL